MISKLLCKFGWHDWGYIFPITETELINGKEYLIISGRRCSRCGRYSIGSLFFIRESESDERPLLMTKDGFKELNEKGEIIKDKRLGDE